MNRKVACKEARQVFKKLIYMGVLLAMIFCLSACGGLSADKAAAKKMIEAYALGKGQTNYAVENWVEITGLITEGKTAIDGALNKSGVDSAASKAKSAIDGVWTKSNSIAYRTDAKTEIETYADRKGQQNYSAKNWATIARLVAKCKETIDSALNKAVVDAAVTEAKSAINGLWPKKGDPENEIAYEIAYLNKDSQAIGYAVTETRLVREYDDYFYDFFVEKSGEDPIKDRYDSNFFESNALLYHAFHAFLGEIYSVDSIQIDHETFMLNLIGRGISPDFTEVYPVVLVAEIAKKDISAVKNIEIDIKFEWGK